MRESTLTVVLVAHVETPPLVATVPLTVRAPPVGAALSSRKVSVSSPLLPVGVTVSTEETSCWPGAVVAAGLNVYGLGESTSHGLAEPFVWVPPEPLKPVVAVRSGKTTLAMPVWSVEWAWRVKPPPELTVL